MEKNVLEKLHNSHQPKHAFTLAEVLITLVIIGVIASITLPSLIQKADKQATISGLKKAYSALTQAVKISEAENGETENWAFPATNGEGADANLTLNFANEYLVPYLNIAKKCDLNKGCWTAPKAPNGIYTGAYSVSTTTSFTLADGSSIALYGRGNNPANGGGGHVQILVDINGLKNPNTMGKDIFSFVLVQKADTIYNAGMGDLARNVKKGGIYPDGYGLDITKTTYDEYRGCGKDANKGFGGCYCTAKIINDGWQIKDDYPW